MLSVKAYSRQSILGRKDALAKGIGEVCSVYKQYVKRELGTGAVRNVPWGKGGGGEMKKFGKLTSWNNAF